MTEISKNLFKIFLKNKDEYDLYERILKFIEREIKTTIVEENVKFYDITTKLLTSMNNAGWEQRHSEQIDLLWKVRNEISEQIDLMWCDKYEEFLP